jgi:predicted TIM-barrel fold metal-dependent hydrolase
MGMATRRLEYGMFDCDTHVLDQPDTFSRYIDPRFRDQAIALEDGRMARQRLGTQPIEDDAPATPPGMAVRPGSLKEYLRTLNSGAGAAPYAFMPVQDWHLRRDARLRLMDQQGVESCLVFPGAALTCEAFIADSDVLYANLHAFNQWYDEEWGFDYQGRIYAPPFISLRDRERAAAEVDWAIARGARIVAFRTGPAYGRSPADPYFDPVWARLDEAGVAVAYHLTECGYNRDVSSLWGEDPEALFWRQSAWQWTNCYCDRAIMDTLSALIFGNLFARFPGLRVISVEHGAEWFAYLMRRMDKMRGMGRNGRWIGGVLRERPSEICRRHVFVTPFPEDDVVRIVEQVGADSLCLGSDFPHAEGCAEPAEFLEQIEPLPAGEIRKIMRDNGRRLIGAGAL